MSTDAEATAGTDETRYINAKQAKDNYSDKFWTKSKPANQSFDFNSSTTITISIGSEFNTIEFWVILLISEGGDQHWLWVYWKWVCSSSWINVYYLNKYNATSASVELSDIPVWSNAWAVGRTTSTISGSDGGETLSITAVYKDGTDLKLDVTHSWNATVSGSAEFTPFVIIN